MVWGVLVSIESAPHGCSESSEVLVSVKRGVVIGSVRIWKRFPPKCEGHAVVVPKSSSAYWQHHGPDNNVRSTALERVSPLFWVPCDAILLRTVFLTPELCVLSQGYTPSRSVTMLLCGAFWCPEKWKMGRGHAFVCFTLKKFLLLGSWHLPS